MAQPSDEQYTDPSANTSAAAEIVVGPLLRYVGTTTATVWVETSAATEVTILGHRATAPSRNLRETAWFKPFLTMERAGLEPATPSLQSWCSPN